MSVAGSSMVCHTLECAVAAAIEAGALPGGDGASIDGPVTHPWGWQRVWRVRRAEWKLGGQGVGWTRASSR